MELTDNNTYPKVQKRQEQNRVSQEMPVGKIIISPLLPFKRTMELQLKRRGYNTSNLSFKNIIPLYYNEFVTGSKLKEINRFEFSDNPVFRVKPSDNLNGQLSSVHVDYFQNVRDIVFNIIDKFKTSHDKKNYFEQQGVNYAEALTDDEIVQAKATDKILRELQLKEFGSNVVTVDNMKTILLIVIGIFLLNLFLE